MFLFTFRKLWFPGEDVAVFMPSAQTGVFHLRLWDWPFFYRANRNRA